MHCLVNGCFPANCDLRWTVWNWPFQRPSSLNTSGLMVDGRSSTRCCHSRRWKADFRRIRGQAPMPRDRTSGTPDRYSITLSARTRIAGGIVMPIAFAVLRLITSSNLVGCWTGRSAGLAPLKILST